ncbi:hypothetical protein CEXT_527931 [Caerostris extrusa]|uniref:Uncharacterized protein n=1 Tax=Caerostris extrusa TaxID=172846 RepID=A0AAV4X978_CAEEX|nr:hypothetical protein CEXT_527931 [Caerostris extrusa]
MPNTPYLAMYTIFKVLLEQNALVIGDILSRCQYLVSLLSGCEPVSTPTKSSFNNEQIISIKIHSSSAMDLSGMQNAPIGVRGILHAWIASHLSYKEAILTKKRF